MKMRTGLILAALLPLASAGGARAGEPSAMGQLKATEQISQQATQGNSPESQSQTANRAFDGAGLSPGRAAGGGSAGGGTMPQEMAVVPGAPHSSRSSGGGGGGGDGGENVTPYQHLVDKAKAMMWLAVALLGAAFLVGKFFPDAMGLAKGLCIAAAVAALVSVWYGLKIMMADQAMQGTIFMIGGMVLAAIALQSAFAGGGKVGAGAMVIAAITPLAAAMGGKLAKSQEIKE